MLRALALVALLIGCKSSTGLSRDLGGACRSQDDCTNRCLPDPEFPNGFCSRDCAADSDCPSEARCAATDRGPVCLFACADDPDCSFLNALGKTWSCSMVGGKSVCTGPTVPVADAGTND